MDKKVVTLKQAIINTINALSGSNTVVVLKGFNKWLDELTGHFVFSKKINTDAPSMPDIDKLTRTNNEVLFMLYEDLVALSELSLSGIFAASNKEIYILDNDYYDVFYPSNFGIKDFERIKRDHDKDTDSFIQKLYGDIAEYNNNIYLAYNDIPLLSLRVEKISSLIDGHSIDDDNNEVVSIPDESDAIILSDILTNIIESGVGKISILDDNLAKDRRLQDIKKKLTRAGIKVITRKYKPYDAKIDEKYYSEYLNILHRKNPSYDFRTLQIYENPYESNTLIDINQAVIIDDIVQNALLAKEANEANSALPIFRDIFVTAPTGAGKSVMFQIPAIYLAEQHNLITLVVSPLIGLMNDQVVNIKTMTDAAITINSDYTPLQKEEALVQLKNGEKSILYLSPEALLSNSDICSLIGDRKIGLMVIDEAHIVATWGKSFRPDYWYLGDFINKLRNGAKAEYKFPIVTFTATATFGGDDNMYHDIIESLKMTPSKYIGSVRRPDIHFNINVLAKDHAYQEEKLAKAVESIDLLSEKDSKTLVYVPYTKHVEDLRQRLKHPEKAGRYFGGLPSGEKQETLKAINDGSKNIVLATKAFGMGIDIDDIKYVYHYAPTGNITDYVQEIGRAARKPGMDGFAMTDFYIEDFRYIRQLYGMSSIKNFQITSVLRKIHQLYTFHNKRNFLVTPEEFAFIYADSRPEDIDAKLKTTLLMIRKDFEADPNISYPPVIFKPRSMFTYGYFTVNDDMLPGLKQFNYLKYFKKMSLPRTYIVPSNKSYASDTTVSLPGDTYRLDYKSLWEDHYRDMSFGMFKHNFFENALEDFNFKVGEKLTSRVIIRIDAGKEPLSVVRDKLFTFLDSMKEILDDLRQSGKYFGTSELADCVLKKGCVKKKYIADVIAGSFIQMLERVEPYNNTLVKSRFSDFNSQTEKTIIKTVSYEPRINRLKSHIRSFIFGSVHEAIKYSAPNEQLDTIAVQLIQMLELARCEITAGEKPEFFIRVNNAYAIERVINNPNYVSRTVANVGKKHSESCALMQYFFMSIEDDATRWDFIERYFLGQISLAEIEQIKLDQGIKTNTNRKIRRNPR